jgi:GTP-binding protein HflX
VEADLLLHVVDASHANAEKQIEAVDKVLASMGASEKPVILVYNKFDLVQGKDIPLVVKGQQAVSLSAQKGWGFSELFEAVASAFASRRVRKTFFVPYHKSGILPLLHEKGKVLREEHGEKGITLDVEIEVVWANRAESKIKD